MMNVLALDTALEACSVALRRADGAEFVRSEAIGRGHGERLFPMIAAVLAEAGIAPVLLGRVAVTVGPGSFTGLRIGVAAARGLALVTGAEAVGLTTLAVHAAAGREAGRPVLALLDSRGAGLYGQLFAADGAAGEPELAAPEHWAGIAAEADALLAGAGAGHVAPLLDGAEARILHRRAAPDAASLLALAVAAPAATLPPRPLYLRPPDAVPSAGAAVPRR